MVDVGVSTDLNFEIAVTSMKLISCEDTNIKSDDLTNLPNEWSFYEYNINILKE
jgi:hypothetical protein